MDERERAITQVCEAAVARLKEAVDDAEVGCLYRFGEVLRHVAHAGRLHLIYEVEREQGGIAWRAALTGEMQLVEDVSADPDYLASDKSVESEIAAPVLVSGEPVAVLDVEFPRRVFDAGAVDAVRREAERLAGELAGYA